MQVALSHEELEEERGHVESPARVAVGQDSAEHRLVALASGEVLLVGSFVVGVTGRNHHAFDPGVHHLGEKRADRFAVDAFEHGRIGGYAETGPDCLADCFKGNLVPTFLTDRQIVMLLLAIHVDGERKVLARFEKMQLLLEQERIRAHVDVLPAGHQALDNLLYAGMHQRFAAGDGDCGYAALFDGAEALFGRKFAFENMTGILDLPAAGAREIAAVERLQHEHQRVAFAALQLLLEHIAGNGPHLRRGNRHIFI